MSKVKYNHISNMANIISELSEELGMSIEMVTKNVDYIVRRLRNVMERQDVVEILLSDKLGTMYCNKNTVVCRRLSLTTEMRLSPSSVKLKEYHERMDKKFKFLKDNENLNFYSSKFRKYKTHTIRKRYLYKNMNLQEVQDLQNKVYNEHQKRIKGNY